MATKAFVLMVVVLLSVMAQATKKRSRSRGENICELPKKVGRCRAAIRRYFYNQDTGECESFTYGGCNGNANNFRTKRECERMCKQ